MSTHLERSRAPLGLKFALLGLVLAALMGIGATSAMAAAPTLEPVVSAQPDDPNTTSRINTFTVGVDPAETETVTQIQYRLDPTVSSPWYYGAAPTGGNIAPRDLANGLHEMQLRTFNADGAGPVKDITWTQNIPAPTLPPVITAQPDNPNTSTASTFTTSVDPAESAIASTVQCSLDGADWSNCLTNYYPGNGDHTMKLRVTNVVGNGPAVEVDWTVDVPEVLNDAINVDDIASTRWDGPEVNARLGQAAPGAAGSGNAGDVNGDGVNDLVINNQRYGGSGGAQIIFGNGKALGSLNMAGIGPNKGYRIPVDGGAIPINIGDQNGDGQDDMAIITSGDTFFYVIYGVSDPSTLPRCGGGPDRCLDPATMSSDQGYKVTSAEVLSSVGSSDFDGDGTQDLAVSFAGGVIILKGDERSGTVDLDAAVGVDAMKVNGGTALPQFGVFVGGIGDLNGDGKDEVSILGGLFTGSGLYVVTGRSLENVSAPIDATTFGPSDGFYIATAPLGVPQATNIGDMNGDGRDDLMLGYVNFGNATAGQVSIIYMPELPTSDPVLAGDDMESGDGYVFNPGGADASLGLQQTSVGDIDGDGLDDQLLGANATPSNGFDNPGAVYLIKGQAPGVTSPIGLGPEFTPDLGVAIVSGKDRRGAFGSVPTDMGDIDGDGLPDFTIGASGESNNGIPSSGSVYVIPGRNLMAKAVTAGSTVVSDTKATINGQVATNGRATDYQFEYGTTDEYGSTTDSVSLPAGGTSPVNVDLSGLKPDTEYHYRLVVTNDLGLSRQGEDRTFTTAATPPPEGCAADSTLPGCPDYDRCAADSTQPGCADYDYCKANAGKPECRAPQAKLSRLFVSVNRSKVKRGKKTTAKATIVNTGTAAAAGLKVCLKAPKKHIRRVKCVKVGKLGAGASKTVKFKVKVKRKARKGKKITLKVKASAKGLGKRSGKVKIRIR